MEVLLFTHNARIATFWSFKTVLWKFLAQENGFFAARLLTVAAMLPKIWRKKIDRFEPRSSLAAMPTSPGPIW